MFVKEENKRLRGPFEVDIYTNLTLDECQALCLRAEKYFCRSVEFDEQTRQCIISEEDSVSQKDDIGISSSPSHHFYDLVCLDNRKYIIPTVNNFIYYISLIVHKSINFLIIFTIEDNYTIVRNLRNRPLYVIPD